MTVCVATNVSPCLGIVKVVSDLGVVLLGPRARAGTSGYFVVMTAVMGVLDKLL